MSLKGPRDIDLSPIQVSLLRLTRLLDVKSARRFDLSSAVVPVVDVTRLIEAEARRGDLESTVSIDRTYNAAAVPPHATTERWRYTVPPGKVATLKSGNVWVMRATVPGVVGVAHVNLVLFRAAAPAVNITVIRVNLNTGTVGLSEQASAPAGLELFAGDALAGITVDVSVGGTHEMDVSASLVERDAG